MSDAVGTNWVDSVKKYAENEIDSKTYHDIVTKSNGHNIPLTKEESLYRSIFLAKCMEGEMIISSRRFGDPDGQTSQIQVRGYL